MTLGQLLIAAAAAHGQTDAVVFPDRRYSYTELLEKARRRAKSLMASLSAELYARRLAGDAEDADPGRWSMT